MSYIVCKNGIRKTAFRILSLRLHCANCMMPAICNKIYNNHDDIMHGDDCPCCGNPRIAFTQSLDQIRFERSLSNAACVGDIDRVRKILLKSPDTVNSDDGSAEGGSGYTPLHFASRNNQLDIVHVLLHHGADPNRQTNAGRATPLHRAAYCGHMDVVKALLKAGANPCIKDADGLTAADKALRQGYMEIASMLHSIPAQSPK